MNPLHEKIVPPIGYSFRVLYLDQPLFTYPFHFHEELELTWIIQGSGTRYVGNHITTFTDGDLVFLGEKVPHAWISYDEDVKHNTKAVVLQFRKDFLGNAFWNTPEVDEIKKMIHLSQQGIHFQGDILKILRNDLLTLGKKQGIDRLNGVLKILDTLATWKHYTPLINDEVNINYMTTDFERIEKVMNFIYQNFRSDIKLSKIAEIANMSSSAFCHFLKKRTHKTLSRILNEIRLGYASQLLIKTDKNISEIAYESGYNSISYFNKAFKDIYECSPKTYRVEIKKKSRVQV
ncbi:AraC family transcriptional regulator [uncultured Microscilla sp.]|uniref:AraC family transcriptional regulator n=1 Tax=uncultured Microscilla sp. TaxID=432653 RepID=UPI002610F39D|nr:AraC family transcriptional regulator [uncultured Microscilla sp.]